jgi:hypothetical protein
VKFTRTDCSASIACALENLFMMTNFYVSIVPNKKLKLLPNDDFYTNEVAITNNIVHMFYCLLGVQCRNFLFLVVNID